MKVIIVKSATRYFDDVRTEMLEWARTLGVDTRTAAASFVLIEDLDGWRAHFSIKRQRDGHDYVQPGTNRVATDYGLHVVDVENWPAWFPQPDELPQMAASDLLEVLAVAEAQDSDIRSNHWMRNREALA